ncbi:spore coat U domain-containing protein [Entomohabitans teleogrylli]|uniref:Csu type fimbrial protein n=1 Tax=Entomohabitans teleogrylli TaxID=1384589 RepID=UPI00073D986E|nr:spore coat protein U domain-containing protein [Entomohabitans teleogrylli]
MNVKHIATHLLPGIALTLGICGNAWSAGALTGQIGVQVTIGAGCTVTNNSVVGGINQWGNLNFGQYADLNNVINGTVIGSDGQSAVTIQCSSGLTPSLVIGSGLNASGGVRRMAYTNGGNTTLVAYRIYSDVARSAEIAPGGNVGLSTTGTAQNIPLYGRIIPADQTTGTGGTTPAAGTYNDTVVATLSW